MSFSTDNESDNALKKKLEELESLLDNNNDDYSGPARIKIPVLDELVSEADFIDNEDAYDLEKVEEQITDLADILERKLCDEMDQLVSMLKVNLKSTIVEQLRSEANLNRDKADAENKLEKENDQDS